MSEQDSDSEPQQKNKTLEERAREWIGRKVVVEGQFPIPVSPGQFAFSPSFGTLRRVYEDGFEIKDAEREILYAWGSIRSLSLMPEEKIVKGPPQGLIIPGRN